jgi:hypothetical protein
MKRLSLALLLTPAAAAAHEGDHARFAPVDALDHVLSNADHLVLLVAALAATLLIRPVARGLYRIMGRGR